VLTRGFLMNEGEMVTFRVMRAIDVSCELIR